MSRGGEGEIHELNTKIDRVSFISILKSCITYSYVCAFANCSDLRAFLFFSRDWLFIGCKYFSRKTDFILKLFYVYKVYNTCSKDFPRNGVLAVFNVTPSL